MPSSMGGMGRRGIGPGGAPGRTGDATAGGCACTCEEFQKLGAQIRAMRGGGMADMSAIQKASQCMRQCQQAYIHYRRR